MTVTAACLFGLLSSVDETVSGAIGSWVKRIWILLVSRGGWKCQVRLRRALLVDGGGEVFWRLMNDFVTSAGSPRLSSLSSVFYTLSCLAACSSSSSFLSLASLSLRLTSAHPSPAQSLLVPPTHLWFPFFIHHFIHHLNLCVCPFICTHF